MSLKWASSQIVDHHAYMNN